MDPRQVDESSAEWSTRDRILIEASRQFAARGYASTSTRDIAVAVGIRQPSLYAHFASKQAILEEIVRWDLTSGCDVLRRLRKQGGGPAVELLRYLEWEVGHNRDMPFDLRGVYQDELLELPEFERVRDLQRDFNALVSSILRRGVRAGDFVDMDVPFTRRMIDGVVLETIRASATRLAPAKDEPRLTADFVLRSLLARPSRLRSVRAAARRLDDR